MDHKIYTNANREGTLRITIRIQNTLQNLIINKFLKRITDLHDIKLSP
jgi:hypothetical protein